MVQGHRNLLVGDGRGAISIVRDKQVPHAKVVLDGPVLRLGVPIIELPNERQSLARPHTLLRQLLYDAVPGQATCPCM